MYSVAKVPVKWIKKKNSEFDAAKSVLHKPTRFLRVTKKKKMYIQMRIPGCDLRH